MSLYGDSHRALHEQFDSQRMAALLETMDTDEVQPQHQAFIESRDMFWLATVDSEGRPQCQYKGGAPGFIRVLDPKTVVFPSYDGNGRYHSMGNISARTACACRARPPSAPTIRCSRNTRTRSSLSAST